MTEVEEHPLETAWSFWFDKKMPQKADKKVFQQNLQKLCTFETVEGFWRHYAHLKRPSSLLNDSNLYLFRGGEQHTPMWEAYPNGGCWILKLKKKAEVLSDMWQSLLLAAIGEIFEEPDVVGVTVAIRTKEDLLSVRFVCLNQLLKKNNVLRLRLNDQIWNGDNKGSEEIRFRIGTVLDERM